MFFFYRALFRFHTCNTFISLWGFSLFFLLSATLCFFQELICLFLFISVSVFYVQDMLQMWLTWMNGKSEHVDRACWLCVLLLGNLGGLRATQSCAVHEDTRLKGPEMQLLLAHQFMNNVQGLHLPGRRDAFFFLQKCDLLFKSDTSKTTSSQREHLFLIHTQQFP